MFNQRIKLSSSALVIMERAASKAARGLLRDFGEVEQLQVSRKGPGDFVSAADHRAEKTIREELLKGRKNYSFLLEESGFIQGEDKEYCWIVDPLDGTTNFLHGMPHFAISIALEHNKEIVAGLIFDPVKDEMFYAAKGMGAYVNDRRLRVSAREKLADALVGLGHPHATVSKGSSYSKQFANHMALNGQVSAFRRLGSAALDLCYLAAGRLDGYIGVDLAPWDLAAGCLIIREAGGFISDFNKESQMIETGSVIAANDRLYPSFLKCIQGQ